MSDPRRRPAESATPAAPAWRPSLAQRGSQKPPLAQAQLTWWPAPRALPKTPSDPRPRPRRSQRAHPEPAANPVRVAGPWTPPSGRLRFRCACSEAASTRSEHRPSHDHRRAPCLCQRPCPSLCLRRRAPPLLLWASAPGAAVSRAVPRAPAPGASGRRPRQRPLQFPATPRRDGLLESRPAVAPWPPHPRTNRPRAANDPSRRSP
mmetsp:Transcript_6218/g.15445  ORF Transcript_6218/g.15445 Transcript_6218/m.15445 type:complete len:206 (-) Transcript_6218:112-729(-)